MLRRLLFALTWEQNESSIPTALFRATHLLYDWYEWYGRFDVVSGAVRVSIKGMVVVKVLIVLEELVLKCL